MRPRFAHTNHEDAAPVDGCAVQWPPPIRMAGCLTRFLRRTPDDRNRRTDFLSAGRQLRRRSRRRRHQRRGVATPVIVAAAAAAAAAAVVVVVVVVGELERNESAATGKRVGP